MESEFCEIPANPLRDKEIRGILESYKTIAVVGLSSHPEKPSHFVPKYLQAQGYRIIPVHPTVEGTLLGERVYPNLRAIPEKVEIVEIFRPARDVPPLVEDAIAIGAKVIWMQEGIVHNEAAERARSAGLKVVMGLCMKKIHQSG